MTVSWRRSAASCATSGGRRGRGRLGDFRRTAPSEAESSEIAVSILRRCPTTVTPRSFRSSAVSVGRMSPSISLSRKAASYCSRPRPRSHCSDVHGRVLAGGLRHSAARSMRRDRAAEANSLADEQLEVFLARAMIVDRRAQAVLAVHGRVGHGGEALFLQSQHDLGVERLQRRAVQAGGPIAEADDIDVRRRDQLEIGLGLDQRARGDARARCPGRSAVRTFRRRAP